MSNETEMTKWKQRQFNEWETNEVIVSGRIEKRLEYSYQVKREKFYETSIRVKRLSSNNDKIPIVISDLLFDEKMKKTIIGKFAKIRGHYKSHNEWGDDGRKHLKLFLFVTDLQVYNNEFELEDKENLNLIYLDGFVCNKPEYRITPLGKKITHLCIKVNSENGKSDCIPCISWGKMAQWASELNKGDRVKIYGRIQSRQYFKKYSEKATAGEFKDVYEVSVMKLTRI